MSKVQDARDTLQSLLDRAIAQRTAAREAESDASEMHNRHITEARQALTDGEKVEDIPADTPQPHRTVTGQWLARAARVSDNLRRALGDRPLGTEDGEQEA